MIVPARQDDRLAAHPPVELEEGDDRAGEGERADRGAERHLDAALGMDLAIGGDAEGFRRIIGGRRHEDGGETDQRMEGGDELRHGRHGDAPGGDRADGAADGDAGDDQGPGEPACRRREQQRRDDGDPHADHAVEIALPRRFRARQPAQRHDEQGARRPDRERRRVKRS